METDGRALYQFHDFHLVDANDQPIGTVDWIWTDSEHGGEFFGVHLRWMRGLARAVPTHGARIDIQTRTISVAYPREQITTAQRFPIDRPLSTADKQAVHAHCARSTTSDARRQPSLRNLLRLS